MLPRLDEKEEDNRIPSDEHREIAQQPSSLTISNVKLQSAGAQISVSWTVSGDSAQVRAYQLEQKSRDSTHWQQVGNYVPNQFDQIAYKQLIDLSALANKQVDIRIRAIGADGQALTQSEVVQMSSECESKFCVLLFA
jgi:hypothetical protein